MMLFAKQYDRQSIKDSLKELEGNSDKIQTELNNTKLDIEKESKTSCMPRSIRGPNPTFLQNLSTKAAVLEEMLEEANTLSCPAQPKPC